MIDLDAFIAKLPEEKADNPELILEKVKDLLKETHRPIVDEESLEWHINNAIDSSKIGFYRSNRRLNNRNRGVRLHFGGSTFRGELIKINSEITNQKDDEDYDDFI